MAVTGRPLTLCRAVRLVVITSLLLAVSAVSSASAALRMKACNDSIGKCARLKVPLDYSGRQAGSLSLFVKKVSAYGKSKGVIFAFAGGPGQAAAPFAEDFATVFGSVLKDYDLVVMDQRGTGKSGALKCRGLATAGLYESAAAGAKCASEIGPQRAFYTTRDSVEDVESVRKAIGYDKIALFGVSYGTKVAEDYAIKYPKSTDRLLLDSVVLPEGPDTFYRSSFVASKRVIGALCVKDECANITRTPDRDVAELVQKIDKAALRGKLPNKFGKKRTVVLGKYGLLSILLAGDFDFTLRAAFPAAVKAALEGDSAQILRLAPLASQAEGGDDEPKVFSTGLYAATSCEEVTQPWPRSSPFAQRSYLSRQAAAALPDSALYPFDRETALASDLIQLCLRWPAAVADPSITGALPTVPTLILDGADDLRTPVEDAQVLASRIPNSNFVKVPATGHSTLSSDLSSCTSRAVVRFFNDKPVGNPCKGKNKHLLHLAPIAPTSLANVKPIGAANKRGRTLGAIKMTLQDLEFDFISTLLASEDLDEVLRGGGLRGGRFVTSVKNDEVVRLVNYEYVPGVNISGRLSVQNHHFAGRLRVSGSAASHGVIRVRGGRVRGVIGGKRVAEKFKEQDVVAFFSTFVGKASAGKRVGISRFAKVFGQ